MHAIKKECSERQINHLLGSVIVQIGIIEVLKHLEIKPDGQLGFTFGELASAYFDGVLTIEEAVYSAYAINQSLNDIDDIYNANTEQVFIFMVVSFTMIDIVERRSVRFN